MSTTLIRTATAAFALTALTALAVSCGGNSTNNGQTDASLYCEDETDCPSGYQCVGNQCLEIGDAGNSDATVSPGEISVFPNPVQFGFAPLLLDTRLDVTVVNVGLGPLTISQIEVVEEDLVDEYSANPFGPVDIVLQPNDQTIVQVTLRPEDGELDFGSLEVTSDDPDNPVTSVALESDYKGLAALEACTLDDATANPVPFEDCQVDTLNGDPILEYGVVDFGIPAVKIVAIRNGADTNAPLQVDDVVVQSTSPTILAEFSVRMFGYDTDGVTEIPVTFPAFLRAVDPANGIAADVIYAEVTFGANFDGIVSETSLVITSSDPNVNPIPISAAVTGCPQDYWDLNDDPTDGCEYHCVYQGAEICNTGVDENCDGEYNTEDSVGCTTYFNDGDNDTFGIDGDWHCYCSPVGNYRATEGGDCDDSNSAVNPNALEICDGVDNDCFGGVDDGLGSTTCGLGVCNHTIQNCVGGVTQTCDPLQGSGPEICDGLDNNCEGQTDEGLGSTTCGLGVCNHTVDNCVGGVEQTCDPMQGSGTEVCDGADNDCDGSTDENLGSTTCGLGVCNHSQTNCINGVPQTCDPMQGSSSETCDNLDNDCDGSTDEGISSASDIYEPNPSCGSNHYLGTVAEANSESSWTATIYGSGDNDWYRFYAEEGTHTCFPGTDQDYRVRVRLVPPQGADCRDYDIALYNDSCGFLGSSTSGGCTAESYQYTWDGICGGNDSRYFRVRVYGFSGAWECVPYTLYIDMWQI